MHHEDEKLNYQNMAQLVWHYKARAPAVFYAGKCLSLFQQGVRYKGRPLMRWHAWCRCWEMLLIDESWLNRASKRHKTIESTGVVPILPEPSKQQSIAGSGVQAEPGALLAKQKPAAKAKAGQPAAKAKAKTKAGEAPPEGGETEADVKKRLDKDTCITHFLF